MITLNPPPDPPYQRPLSLGVPQVPAQVWTHLSSAQQQQVYQVLAQVCRQLARQITSQERPHDHL
jgi:hypothetical protein